MNSPWGKVQGESRLGFGVSFIVTESHGGVRLDAEASKVALERFGTSPFLASSRYWEEDLDTPIVLVVLADRLNAITKSRIASWVQGMDGEALVRIEKYLERRGCSVPRWREALDCFWECIEGSGR